MNKRKTKIPEGELLQLLGSRSEKGFSILYDNYSAAIYGVVNKIVKSSEVAQDVTQDVFVKIWNNFHKHDPSKGTLFTWMLNLARNAAIDKYRSAEYTQQFKLNTDIESYVGVIDNENHSSYNVDAIGVRTIVAKLKPEYRQLIELVYFQGYSQSEIADEFDIPLGTVKTRIRAALTNLRAILATLFIVLMYLLKN
jgi:RNA polymerase sigma-70 factor, ECF subfamily